MLLNNDNVVPNNYFELLKKYCTVNIDIKNYGNKDNTIMILTNINTNLKSEIKRPDWLNDSLGSGIQIHSYLGVLNFQNIMY